MASQRGVTSTTGGTAARRARRAGQATNPPTRRAPRSSPTRSSSPAAPKAPTARQRRQLDPDALVALEEERDFLLTSLRDLEREHDAGDVDDADYAALKDDYTARAAATIRALEYRQAVADEVWSGPRRSPGRILAIAAAILALAVVAGVLVAQTSGRRDPGDSVSGDIRQSSRDLLLQAQQQFGEGQVLEAIKTYDRVLEQQPANAEALTYKGWLLYRASTSGAGQVSDAEVRALRERGLESLDRAVQADPAYVDARIFRAIIFKDTGRTAEAAAELDQVPADKVPPMMKERVDQLRQSVAGSPAG